MISFDLTLYIILVIFFAQTGHPGFAWVVGILGFLGVIGKYMEYKG